jgi:hypothetical protein
VPTNPPAIFFINRFYANKLATLDIHKEQKPSTAPGHLCPGTVHTHNSDFRPRGLNMKTPGFLTGLGYVPFDAAFGAPALEQGQQLLHRTVAQTKHI